MALYFTPGCIVADCNSVGRRVRESRALIYQDRRLSFRDQEAMQGPALPDLALSPADVGRPRELTTTA